MRDLALFSAQPAVSVCVSGACAKFGIGPVILPTLGNSAGGAGANRESTKKS